MLLRVERVWDEGERRMEADAFIAAIFVKIRLTHTEAYNIIKRCETV